MMGYRTPNIDRLADKGAMFTDWYAQQSCTAGRAAFILGQHPFRTGLLTIGMPGSTQGIRDEQPTIAELLKPLGYTSGQFGKNHLGDRDEHLPTNHGFDEFFGNLYHLNAEEEPETYYYPKDEEFHKKYGPRGVIHSYADGMVEHDDMIGTVLAKLESLGIIDNTIIMYSTDNGAEKITWPDGGTTPFEGTEYKPIKHNSGKSNLTEIHITGHRAFTLLIYLMLTLIFIKCYFLSM